MGSVNELFLLAANLAIALMSVTVPTYAISVTYLAKEISATIEELERSRQELSKKTREQNREDSGSKSALLQEQVRKYEKEQQEMNDRIQRLKDKALSLSAEGAVGHPFVSFSIALVSAAYSYYTDTTWAVVVLIPSIVYGVFRIAKSLQAIESAATRPEEMPLPVLLAQFGGGKGRERFKMGQEASVTFNIWNRGNATAENVEAWFMFEKEFVVRPGFGVVEMIGSIDYRNYIAVHLSNAILHVDSAISQTAMIEMPSESGEYTVPVEIREKKLGSIRSHLIFEVS